MEKIKGETEAEIQRQRFLRLIYFKFKHTLIKKTGTLTESFLRMISYWKNASVNGN